VVVVTPGDPSDDGAVAQELVVPFQTTTRGSGGFLFPFRVAWSPDGTYLLYQAWGDGSSNALVAIPADLQGPPVVLSRIEGIVAYEGYPDTTFVPIQAWGRLPSG